MSAARWWHRLRYEARSLFARRTLDRELDEELRYHLERDVEERMREGASEQDARRAAALAFGGATYFAESARAARGWRGLADVATDLRYGMRMLRKYPAYSLGVVLIAALGIGSTTLVYSAVYGVLLRPLPFPAADRIARFTMRTSTGAWAGGGEGSWDLVARNSPVIAAAGALTVGTAAVFAAGEPANLRVEYLTPSLLAMLEVAPARGRAFDDGDATGQHSVALISHALWRGRFAGDPGIVGRTLELDGTRLEIIGVMPAGFRGPLLRDADAWLPAPMTADGVRVNGRRPGGTLFVRLRDGVSLAGAEAWLNTVVHQRVGQPGSPDSVEARAALIPLRDQVVADARRPLLVLLGAVGFVMLLVLATVATLLLSRLSARAQELALRRALGAGRGRQVRQVLTETVLLTGLGGLLGLALARLGLTVLTGQGAGVLPRLDDVALDWAVALPALLLVLLAGLAAGIVPALTSTGEGVGAALRTSAAGSTTGEGASRTRRALVVLEVALSVVLLVGAGLLLKGFLKVVPSAPGFATERRIAVSLLLPDRMAPAESASARLAFTEAVRRRMTALPGVRGVAVTSFLPLVRMSALYEVQPEGAPEAARAPRGHQRAVSANYFEVMEIPLIAGRNLGPGDGAGTAPVAVVNETAAARWWPGVSPIGRRLQYGSGPRRATVEIVGVARDMRFDGTDTRARAEFYVPFAQVPLRFVNFVVHTDGRPSRLADDLTRQVWALDPRLPIESVQTIDEIVGESVRESRFYVVAVGVFAVVAAALAAAGVFSLLAFGVTRRTREIGIRLALGAPRRRVVRLVVSGAALATGIGLAAGLVLARWLTRFIESLLLEVTPTDTGVYVAVTAGLLLVAIAASALPLYRALTVDPLRCLRVE